MRPSADEAKAGAAGRSAGVALYYLEDNFIKVQGTLRRMHLLAAGERELERAA